MSSGLLNDRGHDHRHDHGHVRVRAVACMQGSSKHVKVIDVPGHPRLRSVFDLHAASASCIIFVLDSSTFVAEKQTVAECALQTCPLLCRSTHTEQQPNLDLQMDNG